MRDIASPRVMVSKAALFAVAGFLCGGLLVIRQSLMDAAGAVVIFGLGSWCLCRAYYFSFYVIGRYCDPEFRCAGLWSAIRWAATKKLR